MATKTPRSRGRRVVAGSRFTRSTGLWFSGLVLLGLVAALWLLESARVVQATPTHPTPAMRSLSQPNSAPALLNASGPSPLVGFGVAGEWQV